VARLREQPATKGRAARPPRPLGLPQGRGPQGPKPAVAGSRPAFRWPGSELADCWCRGKVVLNPGQNRVAE